MHTVIAMGVSPRYNATKACNSTLWRFSSRCWTLPVAVEEPPAHPPRARTIVLVNTFEGSLALSRALLHRRHGSANDTLVVSGGADALAWSVGPGHTLLRVPHNSIDFTGLIAVVQHLPRQATRHAHTYVQRQ